LALFISSSYIFNDDRSTAVVQQPDRIPPEKIEILPPENGDQAFGRASYSWGGGRVKIMRLGPLGAVVMLAVGLMFTFGLLFLTGMFLILVGALVIFGTGGYLASRLRGFRPWRR
jgi:hypothetical protein